MWNLSSALGKKIFSSLKGASRTTGYEMENKALNDFFFSAQVVQRTLGDTVASELERNPKPDWYKQIFLCN